MNNRKYRYKYICSEIEKVENYDKTKADNFKGWICHHRLETHNSDGERRLVDIKSTELDALGMYYNRPASELIFVTTKEHGELHGPAKKGKPKSIEMRRKLSKAKKGKVGNAKETHWFNNGIRNIRSKECPPGFVPGKLF